MDFRRHKYYEYDGVCDTEIKGLIIDGHESAWLAADLVASFILEITDTRYDGIVVFTNKRSSTEILKWLDQFQENVNKICGNEFLQFTAVLWSDDKNDVPSKCKRVTIESKNAFPFLDAELYWNSKQELNFRVHLKENQQLKYVNEGSAHTSACLKSIATGVCGRLSSLTSTTDENLDKNLEEIYPEHFEALRHSNLVKDEVPTLRQHLEVLRERKANKPSNEILKRRERDRKRAVYFCIGYSDFWTVPVLRVIQELRKKHNLLWMRVKMSYHRFSNMREILQTDLNSKLNADVLSQDFQPDEKCNCIGNGGRCKYNDVCCKKIVVYKAECLNTGKSYIGCTQKSVKDRMRQHEDDVRKNYLFNKKSDTYANHFVKQLPPGMDQLSAKDVRSLAPIRYSVLWQGRPLTTTKRFGSNDCILCAKERTAILRMSYCQPTKLINSSDEFYGSCRHNPTFHLLYRKEPPPPSTDEAVKAEKSALSKPVDRPPGDQRTTSSTKTKSSANRQVHIENKRQEGRLPSHASHPLSLARDSPLFHR